jgi:hypothetical protein
MNLSEAKPKWISYIGCDQLTLIMAILFSVHALQLGRVVSGWKYLWQFKQNIPIKNNWQELDFFAKGSCHNPKVYDSFEVCLGNTIMCKQETIEEYSP